MVRNGVRVIAMTVFKLNNQQVNTLLSDIPFCFFFTNMACLFRDKIIDLDQSYQGPQQLNNKGLKSYDQLFQNVEDLQDMIEYIHEIFEINNLVVNALLSNALLHYCYLPMIVGSVVNVEMKPKISISTALIILILTFKQI